MPGTAPPIFKPGWRRALARSLALLTTFSSSGCTSGSYAPNAQVDRAVLGPGSSSSASASAQKPSAPAVFAAKPALLAPGGASATALVWPTLSGDLQRKREAAQVHVLERGAVREPRVARRASANHRAVAASHASHAAESAAAEPPATDFPAVGAAAPDVASPAVEAGLDPAALKCEAPAPQNANSAVDATSVDDVVALNAASDSAHAAVNEHAPNAAPLPLLTGSARESVIRPIAIENEAALRTFHTALARLARGQDPDGKVRILAYGASHTQADFYPGYLRAYLQSRFGDGGRGFVLLGRVNNWHSTLDSRMRQKGLTLHHARFRREATSEPLGLFGAALVGRTPGSFAEILTAEDSTDTRFELQYYQELGGGEFVVELDGTRLARIATPPDRAGPAYFAFEAPRGQHKIQVRLVGNGPVRLFGVVAETPTPGVVIDTLGISGARMGDSLRWDDASFIDAVRRRQPDLVTLAYGTNEAFDSSLTVEQYEADSRNVLARLRRATPTASCVFIAPFDLPAARRAQLRRVVDTQRRLARENGCGFWNGLAFMGGEGSIDGWVRAKPSLAAPDHIHLTRRGYVLAGTALGDALLRTYDLEGNPGLSARAGEASPLLVGQSP